MTPQSDGSGRHVAAPLYDLLGEPKFSQVAAWLRDVAADHALEVGDQVKSPSVSWLAEAVTFYEPPPHTTATVSPAD